MRSASETLVHEAVVTLLRFTAHPATIWYHAANGEARSPRTGAKLKRMGVRRGVADICLVLPDGRAGFLEIKTDSGRLSPDQKAFRDDCERSGARYAVVRSVDEAEQILRSWGALRPVRQTKEAA